MKRELNSITNLALELPQNNALRNTLQTYKKRIEEYLDELLSLFFYHFCAWVQLDELRVKTINSEANAKDMKEEVEGEAQNF